MANSVDTALAELVSSFHDFNGNVINELMQEPSPLEFMRFIARNTPFVIRRGAANWNATQRWNATYLKSSMKGRTVNVAVTPKGNADSPAYSAKHDCVLFAKPHEEEQPFDEFLDYVMKQESSPFDATDTEVRYAQTR